MSDTWPSVGGEAKPGSARLKPGSRGVIILFAATIVTDVSFKNILHLPPALRMMLGLGYLQIWSYYLGRTSRRRKDEEMLLDSFRQIERIRGVTETGA